MAKKIIVAAVALLVCAWVVKKTQMCSYATVLWSNGTEHVRKQIPRDLELARVKNEINQMDRDYQALMVPIAERMASIKKLKGEIEVGQSNLKDQRETLLVLTKAVDAKDKEVTYHGTTLTLDMAKVKLHQDFAKFKSMEVHQISKQKLLEAEERQLAATMEQLDKLVAQKREFEIRLAQLQAAEAMLNVASVKTPLPNDNGKVANIKNSLDRIEHDQAVHQNLIELQNQFGTKIGSGQSATPPPAVNTSEIRDHLEGKAPAPTKVAQGQ